ncbi:MAG: RNA polymerase subunit sigma-70, partial [Schwartzia sp.]|nr:RNA polymerase subunit sigma-70 [Schwartzia sp. (in: firmicutes)]
MTENQKMIVAGLRQKGLGYGTIAKRVGVPLNTVKSFCRRKAAKPEHEEPDSGTHRCLCCGVTVVQNPRRKEKKFCSDKCRWAFHKRKKRKVPWEVKLLEDG